MTIDELIDIMPAPDFPTAGIIYGVEGVREGYRTGRGRVVMRANAFRGHRPGPDRQAIIVDELPYQVNKKTLLERSPSWSTRRSSKAFPTSATSPTSRACAW
jgi:DNA gyrase subunit A